MPKLSDETYGLRETELEQVELEGQSLEDHRAFWNRSAEVDAIRAISDQDTDDSFEVSGQRDRDRLVPLLPTDGSAVVLEIGCGTGRIAQHMAPHCARVLGVDIAAEMVRQGTDRLAHLPNVELSVGNGYDLGEVPDASLDLVYSFWVLQHMPKTTVFNYFREVMRTLRPGGAFAFQLPNILLDEHFYAFNHFTQPYFVVHPYPMSFYTPAEISSLLQRAGFYVESLDDAVFAVARKTGTAGVSPEIAEPGHPVHLPEVPPARSLARRVAGRARREVRGLLERRKR